MEEDRGTQAEYLKALAHPTRISILEMLQKEGRCVTNIGEKLDLKQSNISQHLGILRSRGILSLRREGGHSIYCIKDPRALKILSLLQNS
ncbi:MAG TPA: ArsR family transcriptional regulator [Proteobacteria bacterium]|nr:putative HTH-type transcriptional regulator/MT0088 [bacterium BMS3Abin14]HDL53909.1 ArsR family transcriptional regulator [Pseudomonadota bacterium]